MPTVLTMTDDDAAQLIAQAIAWTEGDDNWRTPGVLYLDAAQQLLEEIRGA